MDPARRRSIRIPPLVAVAAGVVLALVVACFGLPLGLAWLHYRGTPDFATYVREHPVAEPLPAELWPEAEVLAHAGAWSLGEVDPFALAEGDPEHEPMVLGFQATLRHGDELLLDLEQELAVAADRESGERHGVALRTTRCGTAPGMRAFVRVWLSELDGLLGPGSEGKGRVHFDALLVAGTGENLLEVVLEPEGGLAGFEPSNPLRARTRYLSGLLHPTDPLPEEGLIHRLRQDVELTWKRYEGGSGNVSTGRPLHRVNTGQYSYAVELVTESQGWEQTTKAARTYTWKGEVW